MTIEVQLEALGHDAKIWDRTSDVLQTAATTAAGLDVHTFTTSVVADATGFNSTYADLQAFVATLIRGGGTATDKMATTLRDVKKQYETDDAAARAAIGAAWSPIE